MMNTLKISFAGAGRVAGALCRKFFLSGFKMDLIVSQSKTSSKNLADLCESSWSTELIFPYSTNLLIVAVPDQRLKSVLDTIICGPDTLIVHTAGSIGIDVFPEKFTSKGVFYPLQTFSNERQPDFKGLPFFLEASDVKSSGLLKNLVESIGGIPNFATSEQRRILHVSAVFASNFTNHMLTISKELALKTGLNFNLLEPLIMETISKAIEIGPEAAQTGPAVRRDLNTIDRHLELLSFSPELQKIYRDMTQSIIEYYKDNR